MSYRLTTPQLDIQLKTTNYYSEHEIVYILEPNFHRPLVLGDTDSFETLRSQRGDVIYGESVRGRFSISSQAFGHKLVQLA